MEGGSKMDLEPAVREVLVTTAHSLKGAARRRFMAQSTQTLGLSQRQAYLQLGWNRDTLRKGTHELTSGITCVDAHSARGRKPVEFHLPHLLDDIGALVADHCQTDPTFRTTRLYCRLTAAAVRRLLIERKGYTDEQLPTVQTLTSKLNVLGFRLTKVAKCRPQKKYPRPRLFSPS
jgi:hypothetical protein